MGLLILALIGMAGLIALLRADYPDHVQGTYLLLLLWGILVGSGIATFSPWVLPKFPIGFPKAGREGLWDLRRSR